MIYKTRFQMGDDTAGEIHVRRRSDGTVQQRHVYHRTKLGDHDPPWVESWIPSYTKDFARLIKGYVPAPEILDEWGEAIAALEAIANGHNDPRTRAIEALNAIRNQE